MLSQINREKFDSILESAINQNLYTDKLLSQWEKNKFSLYNLFGEKLTISKTVESFITDEEIEEELETFIRKIRRITANNDINYNNIVDFLSNFVTIEELKQNKILETKENCKKGIKLSRFLGSLITDTKTIDIEKRGEIKTYSAKEYFDIKFSMLNQKIKFKGEVILSIDPIDYITMSASDSWHSCHNITDGCHKSGTLSYLTDKVTIISYVKGKEFDYINNTINSKVWRMCVYIDTMNKTAIFSRQYPNDNEVLNKTVQNMVITELFNNETTKTTQDRDIIQSLICNKDKSDLHYNDILCYNYEATMITTNNNDYEFNNYIGNNPYCPVCGDHKINESDLLTCDHCAEDRYYCECCGNYYNEDDITCVNDEYYCNDCFSDSFIHCHECGEIVSNDDAMYHNDYGYCDSCFHDNFTLCDHCGDYESADDTTYIESNGYSVCSYCLDKHYTQCDECEEYFEDEDITEHNYNNYCNSCYEDIKESEEEEEEEEEIA